MNKNEIKKTLNKKLPSICHEEIEAHFSMLPNEYFCSYTESEIILHIETIHRFLESIAEAMSQSTLNPTVIWVDNPLSKETEVTIVTWDRAGLFHKLVGALSMAGFNIKQSRAISRTDHITIDTFHLDNSKANNHNNFEALELFEDYIEDCLIIGKDLTKDIELKRNLLRSNEPSKTLAQDQCAYISIEREQDSSTATLNIKTQNSFALLYDISKTIYKNGFDIKNATIETINNTTNDTFLIEQLHQPNNGITNSLHQLKSSLHEKLTTKNLLQETG